MGFSPLATGVLHWPEGHATVQFAADELAAYLQRMFAVEPARRPVAGAGGAWLHLGPAGASLQPTTDALPADAEAMVWPDGGGVTLVARSPRALLWATYRLLEAFGCRWSPHGPAHEHVPRPGDVQGDVPTIVLRPAFARRAYASDLATWHYTMPTRFAERLPGDLAFVDWLAKSGATGLCFIRHANDTQWVVPELVTELVRRGLEVEIGGHAVVELLPRALFATHPEYFPVGPGGERSDLGNICPSSAAALAVVSERTTAARAAVPEATEMHLWGLDLLGGGWCHCPACHGLTPSDQALAVCNRVAEALPGRLFHLAYHDTLRPPRRVRPHPQVWAEFAPRERCYGHALEDPACATNGAYRDALARHLDLFAGRVHVFEYYADAILFGGCAVPLVEVIGQDLDYYRRLGVGGVSCLTFGAYSLWAYGVSIAAFARAALDPTTARHGARHFCEQTYGPRAAPMARYLAALEALMAEVATYGDLLFPPHGEVEAGRVQGVLATALGSAATVRHLLDDAGRGAPASRRMAAEAPLLDYTLATLTTVHDFLAERTADHPLEQRTARVMQGLARALSHVAGVDLHCKGTWGAHDLELVHAFYVAALRA